MFSSQVLGNDGIIQLIMWVVICHLTASHNFNFQIDSDGDITVTVCHCPSSAMTTSSRRLEPMIEKTEHIDDTQLVQLLPSHSASAAKVRHFNLLGRVTAPFRPLWKRYISSTAFPLCALRCSASDASPSLYLLILSTRRPCAANEKIANTVIIESSEAPFPTQTPDQRC
jgi:hypothetical protein